MAGTRKTRSGSFLNPDVLAGRATSTCCWGCVKRDDCPLEAVGWRCKKDHTTCDVCTKWHERGCILFEFDRNFLRR